VRRRVAIAIYDDPMRSILCLGLVLVGCGRFKTPPIDELDAGDIPVDAAPDAPLPIIGLVAWYTMNAEPIGTAVDASGHGRDATCITGTQGRCPTYNQNGRIGGSNVFDGTQFLRMAATPVLQLTNGFTISIWLKPTSGGCCFINQLFGTENHNSWQACLGDDGAMSFRTADQVATHVLMSIKKLTFGDWHHIALWWDGSNNHSKRIYLHGTGDAEFRPIVVDFSGNQDLMIGSDIDDGVPSGQFVGEIDDVRIYDHPLVDFEIEALASH
jgi:hypothetical protein